MDETTGKKIKCLNPGCSVVFEVPFGRWNQKYHSEECRIQSKRKKQSVYYQNNQEVLKKKARLHYQRKARKIALLKEKRRAARLAKKLSQ